MTLLRKIRAPKTLSSSLPIDIPAFRGTAPVPAQWCVFINELRPAWKDPLVQEQEWCRSFHRRVKLFNKVGRSSFSGAV
jgi:hypothetical protein